MQKFLFFASVPFSNGCVAKWLECVTVEQNINGLSRSLESYLGLLTVHPTANGYLLATPVKLKAARKGTGHPTSLCGQLRISFLSSTRHSPMDGLVYGTNLYIYYFQSTTCVFHIKQLSTTLHYIMFLLQRFMQEPLGVRKVMSNLGYK